MFSDNELPATYEGTDSEFRDWSLDSTNLDAPAAEFRFAEPTESSILAMDDFCFPSTFALGVETPFPAPTEVYEPITIERQAIRQEPLSPQSGHKRAPSSPACLALNLSMLAELMPMKQRPVKQESSHARQKSLPVQQKYEEPDMDFVALCQDKSVKFNPVQLGFIPKRLWANREYTFGELVSDFFQKKNNANSRFSHKLYNALKISNFDPFYYDFLGVEWVNDKVLRVDKRVFARLLGIKTIDGSLFHQQGNFPSHGFFELCSRDVLQYVQQTDLEGVDFEKVRLLVHQTGAFSRDSSEDDIEHCKWISTRRR